MADQLAGLPCPSTKGAALPASCSGMEDADVWEEHLWEAATAEVRTSKCLLARGIPPAPNIGKDLLGNSRSIQQAS